MKCYEWGYNEPCWLGYVEADGWLLYIKCLQGNNSDDSDFVVFIDERGESIFRGKRWAREQLQINNMKIPTLGLIEWMRSKFELWMLYRAGMGRTLTATTSALHSTGTRAFDPSSGERDISAYVIDAPNFDDD